MFKKIFLFTILLVLLSSFLFAESDEGAKNETNEKHIYKASLIAYREGEFDVSHFNSVKRIIRAGLSARENVKLLSGKEQKEILKKNRIFKEEPISDPTKAIARAKLYGTPYLFYLTVMSLGDDSVLSITLYDVYKNEDVTSTFLEFHMVDEITKNLNTILDEVAPSNEEEVIRTGIKITSSPARAKVFINGKEEGLTPFDKDYEVGVYTVRLEKEGFLAHEESIEVSDGVLKNIDIYLYEIGVEITEEGEVPGGKLKVLPAYDEKLKNMTAKKLVRGLGISVFASGVAFGVMSFTMSLSADNYYDDEYSTASNNTAASNAYARYESWKKRSRVSSFVAYGALGAGAAMFIASIFIHPRKYGKSKRRYYSLLPSLAPQIAIKDENLIFEGLSLNWDIRF